MHGAPRIRIPPYVSAWDAAAMQVSRARRRLQEGFDTPSGASLQQLTAARDAAVKAVSLLGTISRSGPVAEVARDALRDAQIAVEALQQAIWWVSGPATTSISEAYARREARAAHARLVAAQRRLAIGIDI